jgi:16S rRNA (guanine966-N2)-methyltransferase
VSNPRIIAGTARGIRLQGVPGEITRPITDRVKEALFNILGADINGASVLDLFAGTGSVGIEALSRGANHVHFNDIHRQAIATLQTNLKRTRLEAKAEISQMDAMALLKKNPDRRFEYIYIAPPQYKGLWVEAVSVLDLNPFWLSEDAWVIVQIDPIEYEPLSLKHITEFEKRKYGSTLLVFYETVGVIPSAE